MMCLQMCEQDVIAVIGKYLKQMDSSIAECFIREFDPGPVDFCVEDVAVCRWEVLVNSLVYNHLCITAPCLAVKFRDTFSFPITDYSFEDFVRVLQAQYIHSQHTQRGNDVRRGNIEETLRGGRN